ncbi:S8 family peptidase [Gordonia alkanivorans]|uniref:S8 family peptidase n=1 Tax=Gordonia alkanivorans TaxID=84096 RepID=UPI00244CC02F|nr:S8 family peptidase [Gordonia alkanivorans]MDH3043865.1 S8 family peptidase [Gordonia alkanivorans]
MRKKAQDEVAALVERSGGEVLAVARVDEIGYHGMKCLVPLELLQRLADGDVDAVMAVKSSHVMYMRATGQSYSFSDGVPGGAATHGAPPEGEPVLCVLDGVPAANHPRLAGRVIVHDPDDLAASTASETHLRRHGTAMTSVCVWGDLSASEPPAARPVLVRPILTPADDTVDKFEEIRNNDLVPDLMRRVFRELFEGTESVDPVGSSIVVLNLSVGDPSSPFDGIISSWARTIDWLSAEYGVVVVVSAGNHRSLPVPSGVEMLTGRSGSDRADSVNAVVANTIPRRSLLSPAESINALTAGALNVDGAGSMSGGYRFDPADGQLIVNPLSALGPGLRRSVKPDLLAPGGRALFQTPMMASETELRPAPQSALGPGVRVAAPGGADEAFTMGTSPASAMVAREAARVVDTILGIADRALTRSEIAVATKAIVAHSTRVPDGLRVDEGLRPYAHGYGASVRTLADGCESHEASVLFVGNIAANEQVTLSFPLPNGLEQLGLKRVTATLAWMSPVNWRHRQYRQAALDFSKPTGFTELGVAIDVNSERSKRGTLQHAVWEVNRAIGVGVGNTIDLTVHCKEQAGGLSGNRVDFAVALSLWVAPELGVDVYNQVQQQVAAPVVIAPGP